MPNTELDRFEKELNRNQSLMVKNLLQQDTTIVQVAGGLITVLAAFGKQVMIVNKALSYLTVVFLGLTILQVVVGYYLSTRFFQRVMTKIRKSYGDGHQLDSGLDKIWEGKINSVLNTTQFMTFAVGMFCFTVLVLKYIGRI